MVTSMRQLLIPVIMGSTLVVFPTTVSLPVRAQSPGDIVVIGDSPAEWSLFQSYWNQLLQLNPSPATAPGPGEPTFDTAPDPQALAQELSKKLKVSGLRLEPIIQLSGSSLLMGTLTNGNKEPVTVVGINFEVLDAKGKLVQTGSAVPQPSTVPAGGSVTFQSELVTIPPDGGYKVKLVKDPFVIQGGF